ncbi:MAG: RNA-binding S4 domain-containing protein [Candidatus Cloacimonetes bacterium]|nr:RNA-binding S4 domain-containing protein [Candidatus Cloacimonadota bacterium]
MKFYLDNTEDIFLYQVLKAAGLFEEYAHIRRVIIDGQITVNERTVFKQRTKIYPGDTIKYKDEHIMIIAGKEQREKNRQLLPEVKKEEDVIHGKVAKWQAHPLKKETALNKDLDAAVSKLHNLLKRKKLSLSLAESCTGGMAGQLMTSLAGSSQYFLGGVVTYSDAAKKKILGVKRKLLEDGGAVSEGTARAMADGVAELLGSDLSGAITGIAGPDGGLPKKPVGTVYIAVKKAERMEVRHFQFEGNREEIRRKSCLELFKLLRELAGEKE